jgi:hypothetical protein
MTSGKLFFTVGLPRSGKSSYAREWIKGDLPPICGDEYDALEWRLPGERPRVVICGDDVRTGLHGYSFLPQAEGFVFAIMDVAIRSLLIGGYDVLVDETSTTPETIKRYLRIDINAEPVFIDTPASVCQMRAMQDGKPYLAGPIDRMAKQLQELRANWDSIVGSIKEYLESRKTQDVTV